MSGSDLSEPLAWSFPGLNVFLGQSQMTLLVLFEHCHSAVEIELLVMKILGFGDRAIGQDPATQINPCAMSCNQHSLAIACLAKKCEE